MKRHLLILPLLLFYNNCNSSLSNNDINQIKNSNLYSLSTTNIERENSQFNNIPKNEDIFWKGKSGNYYLIWSNEDLYLSENEDTQTRSFWKETVAENFENLSQSSNGLKCNYKREVELLSLVGNLVTIYDKETIICGIASTFPNIITFDLSKIQKLPKLNSVADVTGVKLTDIFSEEELFQALSNSKEVKAFLNKRKLAEYPKKLNQLLKVIDAEYSRREVGDYALDDLDSFAFNYVEDNKISVRLFLMPTSGYNQNTTKTIDLLIRVPDKFKSEIENAGKLREGFLMKDANKISKGEKTRFERSFSSN